MVDFKNGRRNTVLVLGSGPNANVPNADYIYCANASAFYYADQLKTFPSIKSIVGAHVVAATLKSNAPPELKSLREHVLKSPSSDIIVLDHSKWYEGWDLPYALTMLESSDFRRAKVLTSAHRAELLKGLANLSEPIVSISLYKEAVSLREFSHALKITLRAIGKAKGAETDPVCRPSTGMWTLLIAINEHGPDAEYLLSGVTLTDQEKRLPHPDGRAPGDFKGKLSHHLHADKRLFRTLEKKYAVKLI